MITIEINSVDKTGDIEQETVQLRSSLSNDPALLSFFIKGNKTQPTLGQTIELKEGGSNIFKGTLTERNEQVRKGLLTAYKYTCKDDTQLLDRQLVVKAYNDTTAVAVVQDILTNFTSGFTLVSPTESPTVKSIKFNYDQPSQAIQKLADAIAWGWYVDSSDQVHFFPPETTPSPFNVTDDNGNAVFESIKFDRNIIELKNAVFVRGGEYEVPILEADAVDRYEADGEQIAFPLVYRYADVEVTVDSVAQTVGVDYLDDPTSFDCLYNFQEKLVKFPDASKPASAEVVRVFGNAKVPIIVQAEDGDSIATYGRYEGLKINKSINSIEEAESLAYATIEQWRDGSSEGQFETRETGLVVGQTININSATFNVDEDYIINRLTGSMNGKDEFIYQVEFIKSGQVTFTDIMIDLIGREKDNITIAADEVIQKFRTEVDTFSIADEITEQSFTEGPYYWADAIGLHQEFNWGFGTWT